MTLILKAINLVDSNYNLIYSSYKDLLTTNEKYKLSQFAFQNDKFTFITGRILIRLSVYHILKSKNLIPSEYSNNFKDILEFCNKQAHFLYNSYGKPEFSLEFVEKFGKIHFNISHQWPWVVVGIDTESRIGVDVAFVHTSNMVQLKQLIEELEYQFSKSEIDHLANLVQSDDMETALAVLNCIWTAKEAVSKLLGLGISIEYSNLVVDITDPLSSYTNVTNHVTKEHWCVNMVHIDKEFLVSIASENKLFQNPENYDTNMFNVVFDHCKENGHNERKNNKNKYNNIHVVTWSSLERENN
ncbi:hypothetical protein BB559_001231 [Furculomyces boomerangus]|uniref:holo-[acyl-carrier-protein] synthase n=2 Tax=Harpellales TaxID=61421 RepID=A0A2T9Z2N1_9FUNG|nr:hypothetical protein BB559_001231 [Furculomyces boomerangus]PWA00681.1 hypothetical protein BB558_003265 [Smittium angustum]